MRCPNCGANNHPNTYYCVGCNAPLQAGGYPPQQQQGGGAGKPVAIIVIVVVVVLVLVVGGMCLLSGIMYVWVTSLADTDDTVDHIRLNVKDGPDDIEEGMFFSWSIRMIRIEQTGGDPIDWNDLTVYVENTETGDRQPASILYVNDQAGPYESRTGQTIDLGPTTDNMFQDGDRLEVTITKGDDQVFKSQPISVT